MSYITLLKTDKMVSMILTDVLFVTTIPKAQIFWTKPH